MAKYSYYISYEFGKNGNIGGFGSVQVNTEKKLESFSEIKNLEGQLLKNCEGADILVVLNMIRLRYSPIAEVSKPEVPAPQENKRGE